MFSFDQTLFLLLNASATSPDWVLRLARFASGQLPNLVLAGTLGAFIVGDRRVRRAVLQILAAMIIAWLSARLLQHLLPMPRPFVLGLGHAWLNHGASPGFPSTHGSVAFAFAVTVAAVALRWQIATWALAAAALIAWSRICLGVHFPSDIVFGLVVGAISAWVAVFLPGHLRDRNQKRLSCGESAAGRNCVRSSDLRSRFKPSRSQVFLNRCPSNCAQTPLPFMRVEKSAS